MSKHTKYNRSPKGLAREYNRRLREPARSTEPTRAWRGRLRAEAAFDPATMLHPVDARRAAVLSDIQFPFHDGPALAAALDHVDAFKADTVILNGDILDMYSISDFLKDPRKGWANLKLERDLVHELQEEFNDGRQVIWLGGNHEARWRRRLWSSRESSEIRRLIDEQYQVPDDEGDLFRDIFVKPWVTYYPYHHVLSLAAGNLLITHGETVSKHAGQTARMHVERYGTSVIVGHTHRMGAAPRTQMGVPYAGWENGCLCRLDPEYVQFPNWQQGFSTVTIDGPKFHVRQHHIMGGAVLGEQEAA